MMFVNCLVIIPTPNEIRLGGISSLIIKQLLNTHKKFLKLISTFNNNYFCKAKV